MSMIASPKEFHLSFRVADLEESTAFYSAFLGVDPKDRTPRFSTFIAPELHLNLVLLVNDSGKPLDLLGAWNRPLRRHVPWQAQHGVQPAGIAITRRGPVLQHHIATMQARDAARDAQTQAGASGGAVA